MIFFAEINKKGENHLAINSAMIEILLKNGKNFKLKVFSERRHLQYLQNMNEDFKKIDSKIIHTVEGRFFIWPIKILAEFISIFKILAEAKKKKVEFVFFSSIFPLSHFSYLIIRPFFKNINVIIGLHGELQLIESQKFKNKLLSFSLSFNLKRIIDKKTCFLVYSDMIKENLLKIIPETNNRLISIDHPYSYSYSGNISIKDRPIIFGSIGIASIVKNTHLIFQLAYIFRHFVTNGVVKFKILGKSIRDMLPFKNNYVDYNFSKVMIPKEEYYHSIKSVHYFVFFYGNDLYSLSPSGVFFDALEYEKPIIGIKNDMLTHYFYRFGEIGYLCENLDEMSSLINKIINDFPITDYEIQVSNIRAAKKSIDINVIKESFWKSISSQFTK